MSHDYYIQCEKCGTRSPEYNRREKQLADAARNAYPLWLARHWGWTDIYSLEWQDLLNLAGFLSEHFGHGDFLVCSEHLRHGDAESEAKYPPLRVVPRMPDGAAGSYEWHTLAGLVVEAKDVRQRIAELLVRIDRLQEERGT